MKKVSYVYIHSTVARILQGLVSQNVPLNESATFPCITEKPATVEWWINGTSYLILPGSIPPSLRSRGFMLYNNITEFINSTLTVLGSLENNNTEIMCKLRNALENSTAKLTILGMPIVYHCCLIHVIIKKLCHNIFQVLQTLQ